MGSIVGERLRSPASTICALAALCRLAISKNVVSASARKGNLRVRWLIDPFLTQPHALGQGAYVGIRHDPRAYRDVNGREVDPAFYAGALPSALVQPAAIQPKATAAELHPGGQMRTQPRQTSLRADRA